MGFLKNLFKIGQRNADQELSRKSVKEENGREPSAKTVNTEKADSEKSLDELKAEAEKYQTKVQRTASYLERALKDGNLKDAEKFQAKMESQEARLAEIQAELDRRGKTC